MSALTDVFLPEIEDAAEITLAAWLKSPGDAVAAGEIIAEVLTDKANVEVPSPVAGRLVQRLVEEGAIIAHGQPIARVETA
jgi:pyruvate/2-oxoglutarate dehydrogenase complex dihydrolipoamide acyltransferase (E2) component